MLVETELRLENITVEFQLHEISDFAATLKTFNVRVFGYTAGVDYNKILMMPFLAGAYKYEIAGIMIVKYKEE